MPDKRILKLLLILKRSSVGTGEGERGVFLKNKYLEKLSACNKKFSVGMFKSVSYIYSLDERVLVE